MITAETIQQLWKLLEADSEIVLIRRQTGFGFLFDKEENRAVFGPISENFGILIVHPAYLEITHWGGRNLECRLSIKLTPLVVNESSLEVKDYFSTYQTNGVLVVTRLLLPPFSEINVKEWQEEFINESARIYFMYCEPWKPKEV